MAYKDGKKLNSLSANTIYSGTTDISDLISSSAAGVYEGEAPANITVGGIDSGTDLTGLPWQDVIEKLTVKYLVPKFSSFSITGQQTLLEVGETLNGNKTFTWSTTNVANITTNSIDIDDITGANTLISGTSNDGSEVLDIGTVDNSTPISQQYRITGTNTKGDDFIRNYTITSLYPYFYGIVSSGGAAAGVNRPTANQALIDSGSKVVASSTGTISVNFNSTSDDYLWFAIPTTSASKNVWYVSALNNGSIGGSTSVSGNLFPDFDSVNIDSPTVLWNGITYKIYISNFQSALSETMQLRNS